MKSVKSIYGDIKKGAYVLSDTEKPDVTLAGSEMCTLIETKSLLEINGKKVRLVSIPFLDRFQNQEDGYISQILGEAPVYLMDQMALKPNKLFYRENILVRNTDKNTKNAMNFTAETLLKEVMEFIA